MSDASDKRLAATWSLLSDVMFARAPAGTISFSMAPEIKRGQERQPGTTVFAKTERALGTLLAEAEMQKMRLSLLPIRGGLAPMITAIIPAKEDTLPQARRLYALDIRPSILIDARIQLQAYWLLSEAVHNSDAGLKAASAGLCRDAGAVNILPLVSSRVLGSKVKTAKGWKRTELVWNYFWRRYDLDQLVSASQ